MKKRIIWAASILIVIAAFWGIQRLVVPKYQDQVLEGSFIEEYYKESGKHDVIMVGDCEVYENFSPIALWKEYGITSFIRGSAQQLIWQSYYLLEDTLKYETPKVVIYNVQSMTHAEPQREEYNRMTLDGMKWSLTKVKDIQVSMTEDEEFLDYVFPLLRYHERITELTPSDFKYYWKKRQVTHNGYYMRVDVMPFEEPLEEEKPEDCQFGELPLQYLNKMEQLCREKGIKLVLVKAPSLSPVWYEEYEEQIQKYAKEHDLLYVNYLPLVKELGIDYETDTYDGGLHMNLSGAEKLSKHLGKVLTEECGLKDHRKEEETKKIWDPKIAFYEGMIKAQKKELKEYGRLISFGGEGTQE